VHHYAYTVPDLEQAVGFFTAVLGAELATRFGPLADPSGNSFAKNSTSTPELNCAQRCFDWDQR